MTDRALVDALGALQTAPPVRSAAGRRANCHVHLPPNFSAFPTLGSALESAAGEGISVLGASNYYDFGVYAPFVTGALAQGIWPILGIEILTGRDDLAALGHRINDPGNPGRLYLCGKAIVGIADPNPAAQALLDRINEGDAERMAEMAEALDAIFLHHEAVHGYWDAEAIRLMLAARYGVPVATVALQERHLALAYQEALFEAVPEADRGERLEAILEAPLPCLPTDPVGVQNAVRARLMKVGRPAYAPEQFISTEEGVRLITELGGLPCYPVLSDGAKPLTEFEATPEILARNLVDAGFRAAEFIPGRNAPDRLRADVRALREAGILVSAGTEHNTPDRIPLVPHCAGGEPVPADVAAAFWDGACAWVAIQDRALSGEALPEGDLAQLAPEGADRLGTP